MLYGVCSDVGYVLGGVVRFVGIISKIEHKQRVLVVRQVPRPQVVCFLVIYALMW